MTTADHAALLREALARKGMTKQGLADAVSVAPRTVTNWLSASKPTMPSEADRVKLRKVLGRYDVPGDPVEVAVRGSRLIEWRQDDVVAHYKRHLYEQDDAADRRSS